MDFPKKTIKNLSNLDHILIKCSLFFQKIKDAIDIAISTGSLKKNISTIGHIYYQDKNGNSALHAACMSGNLANVKLCIEKYKLN